LPSTNDKNNSIMVTLARCERVFNPSAPLIEAA
jgi:hypothetical protein